MTVQVVRQMSGLVKDNTGYHLPSLLCGSEGTLGIVTAARFRLVGATQHRVVAFVAMASVEAAVAAVAGWRVALPSLEAAELVFDAGVRLVASEFGVPVPFADPAPVYVLLEVGARYDPTDELADAVAGVDGRDRRRRRERQRPPCRTVAVARGAHAGDQPGGDSAQVRRHLAAGATRRVRGGRARRGRTAPFPVPAPGSSVTSVTATCTSTSPVQRAMRRRSTTRSTGSSSTWVGASAPNTASARPRSRTCRLQRSAAELSAMRAIKSALDPDGIMNPHVLFD